MTEFDSTYQIFQSRNKTDRLDLNRIEAEEGIHYDMLALLKYPQTRAKIQAIQKNTNFKLSQVAVNSLKEKNQRNKNTYTESSVSALMQHIEKIENKLKKYEPDLQFLHKQNLELASDTSKE